MSEWPEFIPPAHSHSFGAGSEYILELPVLGIPTRFESNSSTVLERVEEAFGNWRVLDASQVDQASALVRVIVREAMEEQPASYRYHVTPDFRVVITTRGSVSVCDPARKEVLAWVSPALVADRQQFRYAMLEASTMAVLTRLDRQPVHAAAVVHEGKALLLCARSGTGKSTLAYSLGRNGLEILSDDVVYVESERSLRLWGMPRFLHLTEDARQFFPELDASTPALMANGKRKIAIDLRERGMAANQPLASSAGVCLVERTGGASELLPADPEEVVSQLTTDLESGFELFADTIPPVARRLARTGAWRLKLGADPVGAAVLIEQLFERLPRTGTI